MLKNVQALRALAAFVVVLDHVSYETFKSDPNGRTFLAAFRYVGQFGVDLFFVISGFIMVATCWEAFGRPGASATFFLRRLARIYPPYWLVLVPLAVAYAAAPHVFYRRFEGRIDVLASALLLPTAHPQLLDVAWTLTFEMSFYAVFAVLLAARRSLLLPLLVAWAALQVLATATWYGSPNALLAMLGTPLPLEFVMGALVGYAYRNGRMPLAPVLGGLGVAIVLAIWAASAVPGLALVDLSRRDLVRVVQFGIPAALVAYGAVGLEVRRTSAAPAWLVRLGDASYASYLWHVPISLVIGTLAARARIAGIVAETVVQATTVAIVLAVSLAVFRYVERPLTAWLNARIGTSAARDARAGGARADLTLAGDGRRA